MSELLPDTLHGRELPVLREVVRHFDGNINPVTPDRISEASGIEVGDVRAAMLTLHRAGVVDATISKDFEDAGVLWVNDISREALTLTGQWPSADTVADRLMAILQDLAEHSDDPIEKAKARRAVEAVGNLGRDLLVSVAGAAAGVAMQ